MRFFLPACALAAAVTVPVFADASDDAIDEVVVLASRRPMAASEISSSLSIVGRDETLSQKLITDALSTRIGVYVQQTTPGQGAAIIRGLKGSAVLHLVDGMPLNNAVFRSAPTPYLSLVPTTAVERIEIIRGTPSSLYGSQAVGGVVKIISRVPKFELRDTEYRRDLQLFFDTAELMKSLKATVDMGNQDLAASFSAEYLETGDRRTGGGDRVSPSGYSSKAARLLVSATPTASRSWLFDLHYLEQPETPRIDELVPGFGQIAPSSSEYLFAPMGRLFAHGQFKIDDGALGLDWRLDAAMQRIDDDRITRDYLATTRRYESNRSDLYAISLNAAGEFSSGSWIVGADFQTDEVSSARRNQDLNTMTMVEAISRFPSGSTIDQSALFGKFDWAVSSRNHVTAGLRYSDVGIEVPATDVTAATVINVGKLTGDLGWIYSLGEAWQLLANVGSGFRAPNISDLGTLGNRPGNRFNIPNTNLKEERVRQIDFGVRKRTEKNQFELMIYALQFDDRITSVLTGDTTIDGRDIVQSVNATESTIRGAEAGMQIELSDRLSLNAILNYTWGRETVGTSEPQAADRIPPLVGELRLLSDLSEQWSVQGWIRSAGSQDRLSNRDIRDVRISPAGSAGWAITGVKGRWSPNDVWTVDLTVDNIIDKRYRVHGSGIDAPGRNVSISFRANW